MTNFFFLWCDVTKTQKGSGKSQLLVLERPVNLFEIRVLNYIRFNRYYVVRILSIFLVTSYLTNHVS